MPRQRKPNINPALVDKAIKGPSSELLTSLIQKAKETKSRGTGRRSKDPVQRIISQGDVTKRPMLPEELDSLTGGSSSSGKGPSVTEERNRIYGLTQRLPVPTWLFDTDRSRMIRDKGEFKGKPEELKLRKQEERINNQEATSLFYQTNEIKTSHHPESCVCGKNGICATKQSANGDTTRLPVGISKEEEENWITSEAEDRGISRDQMHEWYQEQKNPKPIRIAPTEMPEEHHPLFSQFDHDPREQCHEHGRNPIGHVVTIVNHDGSIPGLPRGAHNVGLVVGTAPRNAEIGVKSLSPELIAKHHEICGEGTTHKEGCPVKFHDDNCRGGEHAAGCTIPENTVTSGFHEGEPLYKVIPWVSTSQETIQKRHRSQINFNSLNAPNPEWTTSGLRGLQGGITVPASRCIHVPDSASTGFYASSEVQGKGKAKSIFSGLGSLVGSRPALLSRQTYFKNPLGLRQHTKNRTLPAYASIVDQLENPSTIGEGGLKSAPEGFVRGFTPEKPESQEESILKKLINKEEPKTSNKRAYTHVNESYEPTPSCRFCEDASNVNGRGPIVQTSVAPDGRPLYAHEDCDNPFSFADRFKFEFGGPNVVDADFISLGSYNWGMGSQPGAKRVNRELGIKTPSKPSNLVNQGAPGNTKQIGSMGLPEHKAAEGMLDEDPATETEVSNLNENGTAKPPR